MCADIFGSILKRFGRPIDNPRSTREGLENVLGGFWGVLGGSGGRLGRLLGGLGAVLEAILRQDDF